MFTNDRAADVFIFGKERGQLWRILHAIKHFVGCFTITIVLKWWDGQTNGHKYALNEQHEKETGLTWLFLNTGMSLNHPGVRPQFLKAQWKIKNMQLFECSLEYHSGSSACFLTHADCIFTCYSTFSRSCCQKIFCNHHITYKLWAPPEPLEPGAWPSPGLQQGTSGERSVVSHRVATANWTEIWPK